MKLTRLLPLAALIGGATVTSAFARVEAPRPLVVTAPTQISRIHDGAVVQVAFTVDAEGRARDVQVRRPLDASLARRIEAAAADWKFTPAQKAGAAVSQRVVLPLRLVGGEG